MIDKLLMLIGFLVLKYTESPQMPRERIVLQGRVKNLLGSNYVRSGKPYFGLSVGCGRGQLLVLTSVLARIAEGDKIRVSGFLDSSEPEIEALTLEILS